MNRMYYRTYWPSQGLYCPLGRIMCYPIIRVWAVGSQTIPFREVDNYARTISRATYEDAAQKIAKYLVANYGGQITVRIRDRHFWTDYTIGDPK